MFVCVSAVFAHNGRSRLSGQAYSIDKNIISYPRHELPNMSSSYGKRTHQHIPEPDALQVGCQTRDQAFLLPSVLILFLSSLLIGGGGR